MIRSSERLTMYTCIDSKKSEKGIHVSITILTTAIIDSN